MRRVTGIGGIFFKAATPESLRVWYRDHLGIPVEEWGGAAFSWKDQHNPEGHGTTAWCVFAADTTYLGRGPASFMVNYRVENLAYLIEQLRLEGCNVDDNIHEDEHGKFGWVTDPEGNRVELWEPPLGN